MCFSHESLAKRGPTHTIVTKIVDPAWENYCVLWWCCHLSRHVRVERRPINTDTLSLGLCNSANLTLRLCSNVNPQVFVNWSQHIWQYLMIWHGEDINILPLLLIWRTHKSQTGPHFLVYALQKPFSTRFCDRLMDGQMVGEEKYNAPVWHGSKNRFPINNSCTYQHNTVQYPMKCSMHDDP